MRRSTLARWRRTSAQRKGQAVYRKVMIATGIGAATTTAGYAVAAGMAVSEDIQLPARIGSVCLTLILGLSLMSYTAWVVQRARVDRNAIADAVLDRLADRLTSAIAEGSDRSHARTVASFREIVTSELITEQLEAAAKRIHRYGMVTEATGRANIARIRRT